MLILTARPSSTKDPTADYVVKIAVNEKRIVELEIQAHKRTEGGPALLRKIADAWERQKAKSMS
jgi:hypothetical protein